MTKPSTLTIGQAFYSLKDSLAGIYDAREAAAIAHELLEHLTGLSRLDRIRDKDEFLREDQQLQLEEARKRLQGGEPLQYVTGQQWFCGNVFQVNPAVLIPRPETEELVQWIAEDWKGQAPRLLDIGSGSGCISVSLKLLLGKAEVTGCDISPEALEVAGINAASLGAQVDLILLDFLNETNWSQLGQIDVVVSNPPYIPLTEKESLAPNVRDHEPAMALFVPHEDALVFYRLITRFGLKHLLPGGAVYCELHRDNAEATATLFRQSGYGQVELKTDMHGNPRMLRARM